ncbi:tannase/feruloyl esterase family alpha/beta hydrolase [Streptomyces sp. NBC_01481]|uniref:tannase/feruloyl esterase family alpha/beta hydrolase n=1 Tax=Streptomyces sp. NBC_01481 TaxID=2975869 RepID=UPI00225A8B70|nr:tannase/feruloyl esterase family alpha/beta hydrolase [Streptomyces sp. NBC_01481]MCX4587260.1 tannase/feruloyl esterase family alpha/beta hydrolase [Streptomyces sp. NBC_01481]
MTVFGRLAALTALVLAATLTPALATGGGTAGTAAGGGSRCGGHPPRVPGAEFMISACLPDLTTGGTVASGHTDPADWAGLEPPGTVSPPAVPGLQLDGYFPDSSTTNRTHGWNHDSQFVIRLPERWNGGLIVAGPPGIREQYANDRIIGDYALSRGFAFAATDKGNTGPQIYKDGRRPGNAILEWHRRVTQLTVAAKRVAAQRYGHPPSHTYAAGASAGGYLVRWQLERHPGLYSGGIDWHGLLFTRDAPNLLTTLPPALRAYPRYVAGRPGAHEEMLAAGYPAGTEPLWGLHHRTQWDTLQRIVREELDPGYDGAAEGGTPFCPEGTGPGCDTDYDYASRPRSVHKAVERVSLTGRIGKPLITVHGTRDVLLPISRSGDVYTRMVKDAGRGDLHRYFRITDGSHTDGLYAAHPETVRPMLPCFRAAFDAMVDWTQRGVTPPRSRTVPRPDDDAGVDSCSL